MRRTMMAALSSTVLVGGSLAGLGVFLGFPAAGSIWFGVIVGLASGLLLLAAGRRADSFHPTADNAHLAEHRTVAEPDAPPTDGAADADPAGGPVTGDGAGGAVDDGDDDHPDRRPGA